MKRFLRSMLDRWPTLRAMARNSRLRSKAAGKGLPDWSSMLDRDGARWQQALAKAKGGPRILLPTTVGIHLAGTTLESALAVALTLRGAEVHTVMCDGTLPACLACDMLSFPSPSDLARNGPQGTLCGACRPIGDLVYGRLGLPVHRLGDWLPEGEAAACHRQSAVADLSTLRTWKPDGIAVGDHALAGALRYFARADLTDEPCADGVMRRYLAAGLIASSAMRSLIAHIRPDAAVFHHGIYIPMGIIGEACRAADVRVVNWNPAYRKQCFLFSHGDTYHHTLMDEPPTTWESIEWTPAIEKQTMDYLRSRWDGSQDWIWFHDRPRCDSSSIKQELGIRSDRPCIGLLTNVMWDAQLHYPANAFPDMKSWVLESIRAFIKRPDLQLIIRVHPAEIRGTLPSRQPIVDEIHKEFPELPDHITLIGPESDVSTYAAMLACDSVLIYGTKTGVELTSLGIPVIVAGEAWIRNKGITIDVKDRNHYAEILSNLPIGRRMDDAQIQKARRYAYHFFFRRMIPLRCTKPTGTNPPFTVNADRLDDYMPGADPGLDLVCDGIMNQGPFVFPHESTLGDPE